MLSRLDRSPVANWWWTVDRWFLAAFLLLMGLGIVLSFAASPAVAERIGLDSFHFATRQIIYMVPALAAMISVSFLDARQIRRLSLVMLGMMLVMMVAVLFVGVEVKGAHRWLSILGVSIQPSEFLKPAFVVICAWLFAEHKRQPDIPGNLFAMILLAVVLALLVAQPDLGQTILVISTWGVMFFMAGMPWLWIVVIGGLGAAGAIGAYTVFPHVAGRIDRFLTGEGDHVPGRHGPRRDGARRLVRRRSGRGHDQAPHPRQPRRLRLLGRRRGVRHRALPAHHGDLRLHRAAGPRTRRSRKQDDFTRFAVAGLVVVFGFQSVINMGVNLQLMPAKGMTLPFISYGGSSLIAIAISMGMVLALTRRRPEKRKTVGFERMPHRAQPAE